MGDGVCDICFRLAWHGFKHCSYAFVLLQAAASVNGAGTRTRSLLRMKTSMLQPKSPLVCIGVNVNTFTATLNCLL